MVNVFGLNESTRDIGWSGVAIPDDAKPFVYPLSRLRDDLRQRARSGLSLDHLNVATLKDTIAKETAVTGHNQFSQIATRFVNDVENMADVSKNDLLQLCDRLRDVDLWDHGIYLEDGLSSSIVRPITKDIILARQEKEDRELQKQKAKEKRDKDAAAKLDKGRQSHLTMFHTKEYGSWSEDGLPLTDAAGKDISKSQAKKLKKEWEKQKSLHEAWLSSVS